jgi:hypothetical protein
LRVLDLRRRFYQTKSQLAPPGTPTHLAVIRVLRELADERAPLPGPQDHAVDLPPSVVGRPVPGTDLVICYIPAGNEVYVIAVLKR